MKDELLNSRGEVIEICPALYAKVAEQLTEAIEGKEYFSGVVELSTDEADCRLKLSVIIYRDATGHIFDLIPVWWEFATIVGGEERLNDFSFRYLRALFLD